MCQKIDKNGNKVQQQSESYCTPTTFTRATNGSIDASTYHGEAFSIPAQEPEYDYDHRRTMIIPIQSEQSQWPQDIWLHNPHGRQLYQPVLMFEAKTTVEDDKTGTNGHASKSGSTSDPQPEGEMGAMDGKSTGGVGIC